MTQSLTSAKLIHLLTKPAPSILGISAENRRQVLRTAQESGELSRLSYLLDLSGENIAHYDDSVANEVSKSREHARLRHAMTADLLAKLENAGITSMPFKGTSLSTWLHGDPRVRDSTDIDLLVGANDADRAFQMLKGAGWTTDPGFAISCISKKMSGRYREIPLQTLGGLFRLDLHWRLGNRWNESVIDETELLKRTEASPIEHRLSLAHLSASQVWAIQLTHLFTSGWRGLKTWIDFVLVCDRLSINDWLECAQRIEAHRHDGAVGATAIAGQVLNEVFDRTLGSPLLSRIANEAAIGRIRRFSQNVSAAVLRGNEPMSARQAFTATAMGMPTTERRRRARVLRLLTPAIDDSVNDSGNQRSFFGAHRAALSRRISSFRNRL